MILKQKKANRLFVLDTNILMHDPAALFRFEEHNVYLPMVVLEELDAHKRGMTEVARNVRTTNRTLDEMMSTLTHEELKQGIPIANYLPQPTEFSTGRIFLQAEDFPIKIPATLPGNKVDDSILGLCLALQDKHPDSELILVTKDINLRIKAGILAINAEDYHNDRVLDDVSMLHPGILCLPDDFWDNHAKNVDSWQEEGKTFYSINGPLVESWYPHLCVYTKLDDGFEAIVRKVENQSAIIECVKDYRSDHNSVWGIQARNREQNFALKMLLDPEIDFVSLQGTAGSGKTLLALAAGLTQVMDQPIYREIVMTRVTVPVGEDIGFLPGTEEEKMTPWMGALMDNMEVLNGQDDGAESTDWTTAATQDLLTNKIKIRSLNFMRGRTFLNRFIIIDEAQNLTSKQVKTLITRAGPGTKIVCLGDIGQIDTPYLTKTTSGLTYAIDRFKSWKHSAHMTLVRGERSRLADYAAESL